MDLNSILPLLMKGQGANGDALASILAAAAKNSGSGDCGSGASSEDKNDTRGGEGFSGSNEKFSGSSEGENNSGARGGERFSGGDKKFSGSSEGENNSGARGGERFSGSGEKFSGSESNGRGGARSKSAGGLDGDMLASILRARGGKAGGEKPESDLLTSLLRSRGGSPEMAAILSSAMQNGKKKKTEGFAPVLGFVNDDILGKMTKYLNSR